MEDLIGINLLELLQNGFFTLALEGFSILHKTELLQSVKLQGYIPTQITFTSWVHILIWLLKLENQYRLC